MNMDTNPQPIYWLIQMFCNLAEGKCYPVLETITYQLCPRRSILTQLQLVKMAALALALALALYSPQFLSVGTLDPGKTVSLKALARWLVVSPDM